jgi:hypothetical protein
MMKAERELAFGVLLVDRLVSKYRHEWEIFTSTCGEASFYHTYEWDRLLRLGFKDENPLSWGLWLDGELAAIWPTSVVPGFMGRVLYSIPHSTYGAPITRDGFDPTLLRYLVAHVLDVSSKEGMLHWSVDLPRNSRYVEVMSLSGFRTESCPICAFSIDTSVDTDVLWKQLASETRTAVRKARKLGLEVRESSEREELRKYSHICELTMERHHKSAPSWEFFDLLHSILIGKGRARLFLATSQSKIVAGLILFIHNQIAHWWSGASLQDSWKMRPNELLLWHAIEWASNSGIRSLDLGSTPSDRDSGQNLFKRHLGAERIDLVRLTLPVDRTKDLLFATTLNTYHQFKRRGAIPRRISEWLTTHIDSF